MWYGAERLETAVAEMVFYAESPDTPFPDNPVDCTAFSVGVSSACALDLTKGSLANDHDNWTNLTNYTACQILADTARVTSVEIIRFKSVRDPSGNANFAVISCNAFSDSVSVERQSWRIRISALGAQAVRDHPRAGLEFSKHAFSEDPKLSVMVWER